MKYNIYLDKIIPHFFKADKKVLFFFKTSLGLD